MLPTRLPTARATTPRPRLTVRGQTPAPAKTRDDLRLEVAECKRTFLDLRRVQNAVAHLKRLPEPGEAIHGIMRGNYAYGDLVPAILRMIHPAGICYLALTTLGFSVRVGKQLCSLLDTRQVHTLDFLCASFFAAADSEMCLVLKHDLTIRGSRFASARCHAKVLLAETTDGRYLISEGSANVRACRSLEQFCLIHSRALYDFHKQWIQELVTDGQT